MADSAKGVKGHIGKITDSTLHLFESWTLPPDLIHAWNKDLTQWMCGCMCVSACVQATVRVCMCAYVHA